MIETIAIGALSLTTIGAGYQWFMARMEREAFRAINAKLYDALAELTVTNMKLAAKESRRQAQRVAAAAKGRAAQQAKRDAAKAAEQAARDARLAQMRDSLGVI